jgi:hypothetical protein
MQLVGVDYVVPLDQSKEPPTLLGVPFAPLPELGVWALHIWAWRPNQSGMIAIWNPAVSCANQSAGWSGGTPGGPTLGVTAPALRRPV